MAPCAGRWAETRKVERGRRSVLRCRFRVPRSAFRIRFIPSLDRQYLLDDFVHAQVALEALEAARAELAAVGAAHLGRDAQGVSIAGLAVERRVRPCRYDP